MKVCPGHPYPLGATPEEEGVNFSVFSELANRIELCLFDQDGHETRVDLPEVTGFCWHGCLPEMNPGQIYGYRVHGPWDPGKGHRCNPAKLLLDPYARAVEGQVHWDEAVFSHHFDSPEGAANEKDSGPFMPKSLVVDPDFDWEEDRHPETPWNETVIYEIHVKGFTAKHPEIPTELRGTYAGLAHRLSVEYLNRLGVTAVELLPVHQFVHEKHLVDRGLRNYWGYNSIGYLAPHNEYSVGGHNAHQVAEFKNMVKMLHRNGIEVILDVVYNHTAEGNHLGPTLSFKGYDNPSYYRLTADNPLYYMDYTGAGNSLNMRHPQVLQLIMDSLRYWVLEMHVDGFRFDLAATLARELHDVDRLSAFFDVIQQDPVISQVKLIAEPWDIGEGGYQVGKFPPLWSEWNGRFRDTVRDYVKGDPQKMADFAYRITGSSDLYERTGRRPYASINFITAHDGFTLHDLVSYNEKHNEANGEDGRDGENHNRSWNCGVEGPTEDAAINALRSKQKRNFLTILFLSQGVPMLPGGDEISRTQNGNNNAYCQDNDISWLDWENADRQLQEFARLLIDFMKKHPVFRRRGWFQGRPIYGKGVDDIGWFMPDGNEMSDDDWSGSIQSFAVFLNGKGIACADEHGDRVTDDSFFLLFNPHHEKVGFTVPDQRWGKKWVKVLDTNDQVPKEDDNEIIAGHVFDMEARSLVVLRQVE